MKTCALKDYVPPADGEPLDAVQLALVRMWVDIIADEIREELAAEQAAADATRATETQPPSLQPGISEPPADGARADAC